MITSPIRSLELAILCVYITTFHSQFQLGISKTTHITQKSGQQNALSIWRGTSQHADCDANQGEVPPADQSSQSG